MKDILFVYAIDEFENLTREQQIHVNTIYREREPPSTFRIGARTYGIRTYQTNSGGEDNIKDSEFSEIQLDVELRELDRQYGDFCRTLISKRLSQLGFATSQDLDRHFETFEIGARSSDWNTIMSPVSTEREHFRRFSQQIRRSFKTFNVEKAIDLLSNADRPLLEKLNILIFMQNWARGSDNLLSVAEDIAYQMEAYERGDAAEKYKQALGHYSGDLSAQLLKESRRPQYYGGLSNFIGMSSGIPRALLTILRSVFEWARFADERPFTGGVISLKSQHKGIVDASDWYFNNMRKAGPDGIAIQGAVERLANIFRINRFGDKPVEISVSSFSVSEREISEEARRVLGLAEARAFIHRISGGQKERNSEDITAKFQISPMLAPRWELPIARRGVVTFSPDDFNSVFDVRQVEAYQALLQEWRQKVTAPFRRVSSPGDDQIGLFDV
ncbi:hypothetical protein GCM10007874_26610 [Labrys miyagiensis]|uniref:Uncharacterized protein n=2 Tax=Labrys miyagiensis TaxID=346912 RepID=A0ABQ6CHD2_9HYPH|nr:hypothetical protein GCM10007874_26610 [Labrys miyagiensis]